jgi:signal transduction histidine kinase
LKDQKGEPTHIVKLARDMTREKIIEEERKSLEEQLQKSKQLETIGRLAGGVAHDFNNILTSILGYTEIAMMDAPKGSLLRENLDEVLTAGKRGRSLVRQILTFSQRSVQKMAPLDVNQILEEALKTLKPHIPPHLDLQCSIEPHLGKIMGDATNMHQVISNLCMNAIHAMETQAEAKLKVSLSLFIQDGSMEQYFLEIGEYICLEVEDNGPGMSAEIKAKIFEPFFTTKKNGKGTGLGLSVVHGVVKKHHGEILVESELGKGTRFVLYFPKLERSVAELSSQVAEIHSS